MPRFVLLLLVVVGCASARYSTEPGAPTLVVPGHFAEGEKTATEPSAAPAASSAPPPPLASTASSATPSPPLVGSNAPDPTPLRMAEQVEYELELANGKVRVVSVKPVKLAQPIVTPRRFGRYAIELGIGHELIERLRFDFPGTAADDVQVGSKQRLYAPLTLAARSVAHVTLSVPQSPRVRRALLVDRATNAASELEWPLPELPKKSPSDAPASK